MLDIDSLYELVNQFRLRSNPSSANYSEPCTVSDVRRVVENTANVLNAIIAELEQNQ